MLLTPIGAMVTTKVQSHETQQILEIYLPFEKVGLVRQKNVPIKMQRHLVNKLSSRGPQVCPCVIFLQLTKRFWRKDYLRFPPKMNHNNHKNPSYWSMTISTILV